MRFKKFYCDSCSNQFWSCSQTIERVCCHCGKNEIRYVGKEFELPFTDTVDMCKPVVNDKKQMTLNEFSDRLTRYELELQECPFCKETRHLLIHQQQVCEDDLDPDEYDTDVNQFVIECEECGLVMKSNDFFPTMYADYDKLDEYVQDLCRKWDMRGEDTPDDE